MIRTVAIVVAAGTGRRMGEVCKALLQLRSREALRYSLDLFEASGLIDGVWVAVHPALLDRFKNQFAPSWGYRKVMGWVAGGERRQDSVAAALKEIPEEASIVVVHDAARPLATAELLSRVVKAAGEHGAAIPVVEVVDTIKEVDESGKVAGTLQRRRLRAVQTPQAFSAPLLKEAYALAEKEGIGATDDASLVEAMGRSVMAVAGERDNIKITAADDLDRAERIMVRRGEQSSSVGH